MVCTYRYRPWMIWVAYVQIFRILKTPVPMVPVPGPLWLGERPWRSECHQDWGIGIPWDRNHMKSMGRVQLFSVDLS